MQINRRKFLKYCIGSAASLGLPLSVVGQLEKALATESAALPTVIWLNGANCTGCTVSLANLFSHEGPTDIADLLTGYIDLAFHPNLMGAAGDLAVQQLQEAAAGDFILAVDGGIPTAFDGHTCLLWTENGRDVTAKEAVLSLAPKAAAVLCIGTCASFGGMPSADPNPTGIVSVSDLIGRQTINIPGCPAHPDWIVWTVANLLAGVIPELDDDGRPTQLFKQSIHKTCPRKGQAEANTFGEEGACLKELGCKGPKTKSDCPVRQWNNGTSWCIGANSVCLGCTENGFPDKFSPFYKIEYAYADYEKPAEDGTPDSGTPLELTEAKWEADDSELKVKGRGNTGSVVMISNAGTGAILGSATVNSDGKWKFKLENPSAVPCLVKVASEGQFMEKAVKDAPEDCMK